METSFTIEDLALDDIAVTSMRDAVALPETGASTYPSSITSCSCCCVDPQ
jgi:Thiopeptide-type bacteriocin precursor